MTEADWLLHEIEKGKWQLVLLQQELEKVRRACTHQYIEENAYRVCMHCKHTESLHY